MARYKTLLLGLALMSGSLAAAESEETGFAGAMDAGRAHLAIWQIPQARQAFETAQQLAEGDAEKATLSLWLGHTLYQEGRYAEARKAYVEALGFAGVERDDAFRARQFTGHSHLQERDFRRAIESYRETFEKGSARPTLLWNARNDIAFAGIDHVNLGYRLYRLGEIDEAEEVLAEALDPDRLPDRERSRAWLTLGHCRLGRRAFERARAAYAKVIDLEALCPNYWHRSRAQTGIARSFDAEDLEAEARAAWEQLVAMDGAHPNHRREALTRLAVLGVPHPPVGGLDARYGAECNPTGSPIGGGQGYGDVFRAGDIEVGTLEELAQALERLAGMEPEARLGKVVFVKPGSEINLAGRTRLVVPSGVTLAPEGGAHQSIGTPLIGISQDGLASLEPAFADELSVIMAWAFDYLQRDGEGDPDEKTWLRDETGGSVYLRLSTRPLEQAMRPSMDADEFAKGVVDGGYWLRQPGPNAEVVIAYQGCVAPEVIEAAGRIGTDRRDIGVLAVTSADRLNAGWTAAIRARQRGHRSATSTIERMMQDLPPHCTIITVMDGHPLTLSWLGAVGGHRVIPLGVEHFGQTGTIGDLYHHFSIDADAIVAAVHEITSGKPIRQNRTIS